LAGGPLAGVRVLDLSRMVSGPLCGRMLADLGADVVKIEPPEGDRTRTVPPHVGGVSPYYAQMNAGKRNVCIDLKADGGAELVARLAARADVLLENFRPGVLARFGLDAASLCAANPRLIYCSVTGWGQDGPWADRRAYAPLVHADTGTLEFAARHRARRPEHEVNQHADVYSALIAASAVLSALLQRQNTGEGQRLDIAMGQVAVYVNEWAAVGLQDPVDDFGGFDSWNHFSHPLGDGTYVVLAGNPVTFWPLWAPSLGAGEELLADPRFATEESRARHLSELVAVIDSLTRQFADFAALDAALNPYMLAAQVRSVAELDGTEWAAQRGLTARVAPGLAVPAAPWRADGVRIGVVDGAGVPGTGADNRSVLADLGYDAQAIAALRRSGAICEAAQ
jgi:crotonobetainyl-CoA:carnitine CoA-transferase CaiB-like acyl-CoA transferase